MEKDTQVQQQDSVESQTEPSDVRAPVEVRDNDVGEARSKKNILRWMSYLPDNCVRTMIEMGWDVTT